jgi:hypothetical protein
VNASSLGNVNDQIDVRVVVVVASTRNFDISISHTNVLGVDSQVFGSGHDGELNGSLVAESFVSPFADGTDLLDGSDTVVGDEDLSG